jgi:hypothetical protein
VNNFDLKIWQTRNGFGFFKFSLRHRGLLV